MKGLSGERTLVVGLAASGFAAASALGRLGADTVVIDSDEEPACRDRVGELESVGIEVRLGVSVPDDLKGYGLVVSSPGVPDRSPVLDRAREAGLRIISELELGYRLLEGHTMVAVTGTNGKTTTTDLIAKMLNDAGKTALTCGNIGTPLTGLWGEAGESDILVVEVSSFQLANIEEFRAFVSVVLNLAPDHFDWHRDLEEYRAAKMRLVQNMRNSDWLVYNAEDEFCRGMADSTRGKTLPFSSACELSGGLCLRGGWVTAKGSLANDEIIPLEAIDLPGLHNFENVMAAAGAALILGVEVRGIRATVAGFKGLEHRTELVSEIEGVSFFNDSKATNPHAAISALVAFEGPLVAIMGGRNKGLDFTELATVICGGMAEGRLKALVLIGESAEELKASVDRQCERGRGTVERATDLDEAVGRAFELAGGEGTVLFTPACASFDMFDDYRHRGRAFKEAVRRLEESTGARG